MCFVTGQGDGRVLMEMTPQRDVLVTTPMTLFGGVIAGSGALSVSGDIVSGRSVGIGTMPRYPLHVYGAGLSLCTVESSVASGGVSR